MAWALHLKVNVSSSEAEALDRPCRMWRLDEVVCGNRAFNADCPSSNFLRKVLIDISLFFILLPVHSRLNFEMLEDVDEWMLPQV